MKERKITEESFKRSSKRLLEFFEEALEGEALRIEEDVAKALDRIDPKMAALVAEDMFASVRRLREKARLSMAQEVMAKSLGWRNLDSALAELSGSGAQEQKGGEELARNPFFAGCAGAEDAYAGIRALMPKNDSSMWEGRAMSLLMAVLGSRSPEEIRSLTGKSFAKALTLSDMEERCRSGRLPKDGENLVRIYLEALPGYREGGRGESGRQSDTTIEQHGYLEMQIKPVAGFLISIETMDSMLIPPAGLESVAPKMEEALGREDLGAFWRLAPDPSKEGVRLSSAMLALARCLNAKKREEMARSLLLCIETPKMLFDLSVASYGDIAKGRV